MCQQIQRSPLLTSIIYVICISSFTVCGQQTIGIDNTAPGMLLRDHTSTFPSMAPVTRNTSILARSYSSCVSSSSS